MPSGAAVTIYKNVLHVRPPLMDCTEIQHGEISIAGFNIVAARHPGQSSVFVFAEHIEYKDNYVPYRMAGIGCYGFRDMLECFKNLYSEEYKKIPDKYLDPDKYDYTSFSSHPSGEWGFNFYGEDDQFTITINTKRLDIGDMWCGVTLETSLAFIEWLKEVAPEEYFKMIKLSTYFASQLGVQLPTTEVGKSTSPILNQIGLKCERCAGTGRRHNPATLYPTSELLVVKCSACNGLGRIKNWEQDESA